MVLYSQIKGNNLIRIKKTTINRNTEKYKKVKRKKAAKISTGGKYYEDQNWK